MQGPEQDHFSCFNGELPFQLGATALVNRLLMMSRQSLEAILLWVDNSLLVTKAKQVYEESDFARVAVKSAGF